MPNKDALKLVETFRVPIQDEYSRLSDFLVGKFKTIHSRKGIKNAIKKGVVFINGVQGYTGDHIKGGETIDLYQSDKLIRLPNVDMRIEVLYEDDYLALVYKPAGIVVSGNKRRTLQNALPANLKVSTLEDGLQRPEPIHRLDYPTSGVLLVGKTQSAVIALNKLFEDKQVSKVYYAITVGKMDEEGTINESIDDKPSQTIYKVLNKVDSDRFDKLNLLELRPLTGRRHQLRIHLSNKGNPILGDQQYGSPNQSLIGKGLFLHASKISFIHPITLKSISVSAELPKKFTRIFVPPIMV